MHRVFNLRMFVILLLIVVLVGCGIYFLHNYQLKNQAKIYLQKADQAVADKDLPKARDFLERYLHMKPDDIESHNRHAFIVDDSVTPTSTIAKKSFAYIPLEKAYRQYSSQKSATTAQPPVELYQRLAL